MRDRAQPFRVALRVMLLVIVPHGFDVPPLLWERAAVVACGSAADMVAALQGSPAPVVVVTDGLAGEDLDTVANAIRPRGQSCIEVRSTRWDGESPSPVSAACRGVISGFGPNGLAAAAALLTPESESARTPAAGR